MTHAFQRVREKSYVKVFVESRNALIISFEGKPMSTIVQHMPDVVHVFNNFHVFNNHIKSDFEKIIPNRETNAKII